MTGPLPVEIAAPAKLTLSLRVVGVRADGFHLLDSEMVSLDLADTLYLSAGTGVEVVDEHGATIPGISGDSDNLVSRALVLAGREARVRLVKRIPAGAGLGGGSSDAAAVLRWAGVLDPRRAALLGADVPFCLGGGRARVRGVGEAVEPLPVEEIEGDLYTLLTPPIHVSTVLVYRTWDAMGGPTGDGGNDLEPAALAAVPDLGIWRDRLGNATGETPRLAGSGGTWFVPGSHPGDSRRVVRVSSGA